ncbi:MAG: TerB family tellurite resistance protein [Campylobacterota bacterium]|nr:TerB family tellurite resistance protein [Campylobacterota bacterium]
MSDSDLLLLLFLGYILYTIFKSFAKKKEEQTYSQKTFRNFLVTKESIKNSDLGLFVALAAKVAKADGRVDRLEAQLVGMMFDDISAVFPDPHKAREILKEIFNEEKNRTDDTQAIAQRLGQSIRLDRRKQQQFMGFLIQLAFADGEVSQNENAALQTIARAFNFDTYTYNAIFNQFESMMKNVHPQSNLKDAYKLLGVNESDDMNVIKKAYRNKVREFHPDIIASQNKSEAYMEEATKKTQELNQAYEMIKRERK